MWLFQLAVTASPLLFILLEVVLAPGPLLEISLKISLQLALPAGKAKYSKVRNCAQCHFGSIFLAVSVKSPGPLYFFSFAASRVRSFSAHAHSLHANKLSASVKK